MTIRAVVEIVFWAGIAVALYAYVVFPLLLAVTRRAQSETPRSDADRPPDELVTLIIPAFNEEASLGAKIRNALESEYRRDLLDVIVVSDASTDGTNDIAREFEAHGVRLIVQDVRRGKTAGLNRAVAVARGDILVFTDANAAFPPATLATLIRRFSNPRVGLVTGYTKYRVTESGEVAEATNAYTSLERLIKRGESRSGCCVGADGAIFAMRRELYKELRDDDINDFVLPLRVIGEGYACVLAEDAYCVENPGKNLDSEFRRQSRIANRTLRAIWRHAHLLNPFRFPAFSFFLISHKVIRFLVPWFLLVSFVSLMVLARDGGVYAWFTAGTLGMGVLLAALWVRPDWASGPLGHLARMFRVFATINIAVLHGWGKFVSGYGEVTWQHDRGKPVSR